MAYRAPVSEMVFMMNAAAGLQEGIADGTYADLADGMAEATLNEAAKFAENVLAPLHRVGDQVGAKWKDGVVTTPPSDQRQPSSSPLRFSGNSTSAQNLPPSSTTWSITKTKPSRARSLRAPRSAAPIIFFGVRWA